MTHADPSPTASTAPAVSPPRWSGNKSAIAAALALGAGGIGGVVAAQAVPAGSGAGIGRGGPPAFRGAMPGAAPSQGWPGAPGAAPQGAAPAGTAPPGATPVPGAPTS